jgi:hypothetical protein
MGWLSGAPSTETPQALRTDGLLSCGATTVERWSRERYPQLAKADKRPLNECAGFDPKRACGDELHSDLKLIH